jgi:hypothetical protein
VEKKEFPSEEDYGVQLHVVDYNLECSFFLGMAPIRPSQLTKNLENLGGGTTIINCTVVIAGGISLFSLFIYLNIFECPTIG